MRIGFSCTRGAEIRDVFVTVDKDFFATIGIIEKNKENDKERKEEEEKVKEEKEKFIRNHVIPALVAAQQEAIFSSGTAQEAPVFSAQKKLKNYHLVGQVKKSQHESNKSYTLLCVDTCDNVSQQAKRIVIETHKQVPSHIKTNISSIDFQPSSTLLYSDVEKEIAVAKEKLKENIVHEQPALGEVRQQCQDEAAELLIKGYSHYIEQIQLVLNNAQENRKKVLPDQEEILRAATAIVDNLVDDDPALPYDKNKLIEYKNRKLAEFRLETESICKEVEALANNLKGSADSFLEKEKQILTDYEKAQKKLNDIKLNLILALRTAAWSCYKNTKEGMTEEVRNQFNKKFASIAEIDEFNHLSYKNTAFLDMPLAEISRFVDQTNAEKKGFFQKSDSSQSDSVRKILTNLEGNFLAVKDNGWISSQLSIQWNKDILDLERKINRLKECMSLKNKLDADACKEVSIIEKKLLDTQEEQSIIEMQQVLINQVNNYKHLLQLKENSNSIYNLYKEIIESPVFTGDQDLVSLSQLITKNYLLLKGIDNFLEDKLAADFNQDRNTHRGDIEKIKELNRVLNEVADLIRFYHQIISTIKAQSDKRSLNSQTKEISDKFNAVIDFKKVLTHLSAALKMESQVTAELKKHKLTEDFIQIANPNRQNQEEQIDKGKLVKEQNNQRQKVSEYVEQLACQLRLTETFSKVKEALNQIEKYRQEIQDNIQEIKRLQTDIFLSGYEETAYAALLKEIETTCDERNKQLNDQLLLRDKLLLGDEKLKNKPHSLTQFLSASPLDETRLQSVMQQILTVNKELMDQSEAMSAAVTQLQTQWATLKIEQEQIFLLEKQKAEENARKERCLQEQQAAIPQVEETIQTPVENRVPLDNIEQEEPEQCNSDTPDDLALIISVIKEGLAYWSEKTQLKFLGRGIPVKDENGQQFAVQIGVSDLYGKVQDYEKSERNTDQLQCLINNLQIAVAAAIKRKEDNAHHRYSFFRVRDETADTLYQAIGNIKNENGRVTLENTARENLKSIKESIDEFNATHNNKLGTKRVIGAR